MESTPLISSSSTMSKLFSKYGATSEVKAAPAAGQPKADPDAPPSDIDNGSLYQVRQAKRQIGVTSAIFLVSGCVFFESGDEVNERRSSTV
jgi:hypothetical protein